MIAMLLAADGGALNNIMLVVLPVGGAILLAYGVWNVAFDLRAANRKKISSRLKGGTAAGRKGNDQIDFESFRKQTAEAKGVMAKAIAKLSFTTRMQRTLEQANLPWSAAQTLVNLTAISAALGAFLLVAGAPIAALAGVVLGAFILPILYISRRRKKRLKRLMNQLPDVFELLSQALRAGNSLASAMQLLAKQMPDPAGTEFGRVFHEQNLGVKMEDALRNLAERIDILDVRFFVTAVLIQRQVGGDLAEVLDKIGFVIRERIQLFGTVQALTAEGRLSGSVLLALPVVVFIVLTYLNPGYIDLLLTDPLGKMMLTTAIVMMLMGWALIKKIVNIKI